MGEERIGQGKDSVKNFLMDNPDIAEQVEQQIRAAAYFQKVPQTGVVISHEFVKKGDQPPEFVFVHPMSGHIPNNSALIVEPFQKAVFTAAGRPQVLEVPDLYPIAGDERNEQELLRAIAAGERGRIFQNINTRISFFDMRQHPCTSEVATVLPGNVWRLSVSVGYNMRIVDHTQLEQIAFDMKRGVTVIPAKGWYSKEEKEVIMVVTRKTDLNLLLRYVKSIDPDAFLSVSSVMGVYGQGFDTIKVKTKK
jgi:hypothetical protein